MKNRDNLRTRAIGDLMLTICECRFKICPIEIVGERKLACVTEDAPTEKCKRCVMEWLNEEMKS